MLEWGFVQIILPSTLSGIQEPLWHKMLKCHSKRLSAMAPGRRIVCGGIFNKILIIVRILLPLLLP